LVASAAAVTVGGCKVALTVVSVVELEATEDSPAVQVVEVHQAEGRASVEAEAASCCSRSPVD
jgi:hypothetical protein